MAMLAEVATKQQPGDAKYGVIDVILTSGYGQDASTQMADITEPTSMSLVAAVFDEDTDRD